jgi:hypothetical protein
VKEDRLGLDQAEAPLDAVDGIVHPVEAAAHIREIAVKAGDLMVRPRSGGLCDRIGKRVPQVIMRFGTDDQRESGIQISEEPCWQLEFAVGPTEACLGEMAAPFAKLRRVVLKTGDNPHMVQVDLLYRHTERPMVAAAEAE